MLKIKKENLHHKNSELDKKACDEILGQYDLDTELCTQFYRPKEICIQITK